jgi:hypothetical protein
MKNFSKKFIIFSAIILIGFFAVPHKSLAVEMNKVLAPATGEASDPANFKVSPGSAVATIPGYGGESSPGSSITVYSSGPDKGFADVVFSININQSGSDAKKGVEDSANKGFVNQYNQSDGTVANGNDLGGWGAFYNSSFSDSEFASGMFLEIGDKKDSSASNLYDKDYLTFNGGDPLELGLAQYLKNGLDSTKPVSSSNKQVVLFDQLSNLGILFKASDKKFVGGQTYYARLRFEENNSTDVAVSDVFNFKLPTTTTQQTPPTPPSATTGSSLYPGDNLPSCGLSISDDSSIYGCVVQIFYYAFWLPTSYLAGLAGKLLDYFIFYSINSSSYKSGFINEGWKVVRDIANIGFIFVLLYVALRTILNLGGSQSKKMITWVVIIALIINFSLFFSKVVVDAGNILAGVLYNNVGAVATKDGQPAPVQKGEAGEEQISVGIVNRFDPQKIMDSGGFSKDQNNANPTPFLVIVIIATLINVFMIFTFLSVMLLFVGRTIGLMVSMIFSPFAFISLTIPGAGKIMQKWSWDQWFPELVSMAFMAPIFIFFLWLILLFLDVSPLKGAGESFTQNGNTFMGLIAIIAPFILIVGLLKKAKEVAQDMAGEIAGAINKAAGAALGIAGGAVLGGVGMLGRATVGRAATEGAVGTFRGDLGTGGFRRGAREISEGKVNIPLKDVRGPVEKARQETAAANEEAEKDRSRREGIATVGETTPFIGAEIKNIPESRVTPKTTGPAYGRAGGIGFGRERAPEENERGEKTEEERARNEGIATVTTIKQVPIQTQQQQTQAQEKEQQPVQKQGQQQNQEQPKEEKPEQTQGQQQQGQKQIPNIQATEASKEKAKEAAAGLKAETEKERMTLKDLAAGKAGGVQGFIARQALGALNNISKNSLDPRNTKLVKLIEKQTGISFGKGHKGGYEDDYKARKDKELKYAKSLEPSEFEKIELNRLDSLHKDLMAMKQQGLKSHPKTGENLDALINNAGISKDREKDRLKMKTDTRRNSYGKTVDSGTGLNFIASKVLGKNTANNVAIGNAIRSGGEKSDAEKLWESVKKEYEKSNPPAGDSAGGPAGGAGGAGGGAGGAAGGDKPKK